jgi:hypothetical protein
VHLEDLVLHDDERDIRVPTHALTQAHMVLLTRRQIAAADPTWATNPAGLSALCCGAEPDGDDGPALPPAPTGNGADDPQGEGTLEHDAFASELAAIDAVLERSRQVLAGAAPSRKRDRLIDEVGRDEAEPIEAWRTLVANTGERPPLLAAAVAIISWTEIVPSPAGPGSALSWPRACSGREARHAITCPAFALRAVPRERRGARDTTVRWVGFLDGLKLGAEQGLKDHDRWLLARAPGPQARWAEEEFEAAGARRSRARAAAGFGGDDRRRTRGHASCRAGLGCRAPPARDDGSGPLPSLGCALTHPSLDAGGPEVATPFGAR